MKLIFVHGRGQVGKDREELRLFWVGCLEKAFRESGLKLPDELQIELPFYADDLGRMVGQVDSSRLLTDILLRSGRSLPAEDGLRREIIHEIWESGVPGRGSLVDRIGTDPPSRRGPLNWPGTLTMLRALDRTPIGGDVIDAFARDVWIYLTFGGIREKVDAIVHDAIPDTACVVVAHPLGSIVAYNVLSRRGPGASEIPLLVTLGCPLGIRAINSRLPHPLARPIGVGVWFNARDRHDLIALHPLDREHFDIEAPVEDYSQVDNRTANRHSVDGYLADPRVIQRIHDALIF